MAAAIHESSISHLHLDEIPVSDIYPSNSSQISVSSHDPPVAVCGCGPPTQDCTNNTDKDPENQCKPPSKKRSRKSIQIPKILRLVKQKPIVKSPMFMTSPSSIYAAVCKYNSLLDALHGVNNNLDYLHQEEEDFLVIINIHFGGCSIFEHQFDSILASQSSLSPTGIEEALHQSVRHLCHNACFLRAHHPIREYNFLWRDITIDKSDCSTITGFPDRRRLKKENLLSGWSCKLFPTIAESTSRDITDGTKKMLGRALPLVFVSPDGMEFNTKTKAINYMNKSLSSSQLHTLSTHQTSSIQSSTTLIDFTAKMNKLYSPLGLLEELFLHDPWKLMVSTICLNVTTRQQVDRILYQLLQKWPDAESTAKANWEDISSVVSPLGLGTKRAKGLIRFSEEYLALTKDYNAFSLTEKQVLSLYNIGQYGWTAYEVFILKQLPSGSVKVCDHALQLYVEYQLGRQASEKQTALIH